MRAGTVPKGYIMSNKSDGNIELSIEISQKFEFYILALVFTILGLAIQTAPYERTWWGSAIEVIAWLVLLISGLSGLSRLEWMPVCYRHFGYLHQEKRSLQTFDQGLGGRPILNEKYREWSLEELQKAKEEVQNQILMRQGKLDRLERWSFLKYKIHKWSFVVGLLLLFISRAFNSLHIG